MALRNAFDLIATELTLAKRFGGGKSAKTAIVTAAGDTEIHTPAAGKAIKLFWISAINDPSAANSPLITVKFSGAGSNLYAAYAVAHWEEFTGAVGATLIVNLDKIGSVAVSMHYQEV